MDVDLRWLRPPSQAYNLHTLRTSPLSEISGSLGDLGTLLPLLIALTLTKSISLSSTLVFTGIANVLTGIFYGIPLPVQPMKAIAAVAIAQSFSVEETSSAGIFVAGVIGLASVLGLLGWAGRVVPIPIVKGIQVGAGLSLALSAGSTLLQPLGWTKPNAGDNLIWTFFTFILFLIMVASPRRDGLPRLSLALLLLLVGLVIAAISLSHSEKRSNMGNFLGLWRPFAVHITWLDFRTGALTAGVGQLPLTTLNSIIAVTHLSAELLPERPTPSTTSLGISVAVMNLVGCWFGAMPACHGSGGLAGQYRFGARSGASVIMLGLTKVVLGLFVGERWLVTVLERFPSSILGIMVIAAGIELAKVGQGLNSDAKDLWEVPDALNIGGDKRTRQPSEQEGKDRWFVMMVTVAGLLAFKNDAVGFIAGLLCHWSLQAPFVVERWRRWRSKSDWSTSRAASRNRRTSDSVGLLDEQPA
ncbi:MAG: hypothetical protein M1828_002323 [Chrysothrix sp. TS-e1954]|nr:MAG: hypothetical protein M1828_002323 [Chrysothrix sp. TS-e1954]